MPKQKSHKASLKRMKVTGTGKVMVHPVGARHMMSGKRSRNRRHMRRMRPLKNVDRKRTLRALHGHVITARKSPPPAPKSEGA